MNTMTPWWQNGVIYQIYPKSFQDSNGDGHGDLVGILRRLDYLQLLGVDAIWITPIYVSPQVDNGYDVADYCAIDPAYGSLAEFDALVAAAHQRGIHIVMDMVFNHSSTRHPWFLQSRDPASPFRSFYLWRDGRDGGPPNNWRSKFGGSAWQWHPESGQYYLHLFASEQADLNWAHPPVREELKKICRFWSDRGVDGMRLDVVNLTDKPLQLDHDPLSDGRRFYTDGPQVQDYLRELSRDVFRPHGLMTLGEMSSTNLEKCQQYAALDGEQLSMVAQFHHLKVDYANGDKWTPGPTDYVALKQIFSRWQQGMHNRAWHALFWCNHDQPRIVSRFGDAGEYRVQSAKMLAMVLHGMQGTPFIYQGEELGMTNPDFRSIDDYRDVESLNLYRQYRQQQGDMQQLMAILAVRSRDNSRTPMQWDAGHQAGFTTGQPWMGTCSNYPHINARQALADQNSVFYCYQRLIALRKGLPLLTRGDYQDLSPHHPALWHYQRQWQSQRLLVLANLTDHCQPWHPASAVEGNWQKLLANYADTPELPQPLQLRPYEAVYWLGEV